MDIGKPKRIIEVEPTSLPIPEPGVPQVEPVPATEPAHTPEPAEPR